MPDFNELYKADQAILSNVGQVYFSNSISELLTSDWPQNSSFCVFSATGKISWKLHASYICSIVDDLEKSILTLVKF